MTVGLGARRNSMDTKFMVSPPTGQDTVMSGGQSSGRLLIPLSSRAPAQGPTDTVHLWVWGITIAAIVYLLGVHWTFGEIRSLVD